MGDFCVVWILDETATGSTGQILFIGTEEKCFEFGRMWKTSNKGELFVVEKTELARRFEKKILPN